MKKLKALILTASVATATTANAALPTAVTDQFTTTTADLTAVGGLLVGLAVLVMGFKWLKAMFF